MHTSQTQGRVSHYTHRGNRSSVRHLDLKAAVAAVMTELIISIGAAVEPLLRRRTSRVRLAANDRCAHLRLHAHKCSHAVFTFCQIAGVIAQYLHPASSGDNDKNDGGGGANATNGGLKQSASVHDGSPPLREACDLDRFCVQDWSTPTPATLMMTATTPTIDDDDDDDDDANVDFEFDESWVDDSRFSKDFSIDSGMDDDSRFRSEDASINDGDYGVGVGVNKIQIESFTAMSSKRSKSSKINGSIGVVDCTPLTVKAWLLDQVGVITLASVDHLCLHLLSSAHLHSYLLFFYSFNPHQATTNTISDAGVGTPNLLLFSPFILDTDGQPDNAPLNPPDGESSDGEGGACSRLIYTTQTAAVTAMLVALWMAEMW
jgi:hypothetical protein